MVRPQKARSKDRALGFLSGYCVLVGFHLGAEEQAGGFDDLRGPFFRFDGYEVDAGDVLHLHAFLALVYRNLNTCRVPNPG